MSGNGTTKSEPTLSRVGRRPVPIPPGVNVSVEGGILTAQGPAGTLSRQIHPEVVIRIENGTVVVDRYSARKFHRSLHGLWRSLVSNTITGVTEGYQKTIELVGVGYRVQQAGDGIVLNVGLSHSVEVQPMDGVILTVEGNNRIHVRGLDKQRVGEMAARIRRVRPPDAYKGKGARLSTEVVRLKPGKAGRKTG